MKLLHTADWHLGHRLHENSQQEEQQLFLEWLIEHIDVLQIDILLISGDIGYFGVMVPSVSVKWCHFERSYNYS